jgi:hypothetical protein
MDLGRVLAVSTTPVVLVSAGGLLMLALYNRLGMILARLRAFHQQKLVLLDGLTVANLDDRRQQLAMLDQQVARVTKKARVIQSGLFFLLTATGCFLLCALLAVAATSTPHLEQLAVSVHVIGLFLFFAGILRAGRELTMSLTPLEEETRYLNDVMQRRFDQLGSPGHPSAAPPDATVSGPR